MGSMTNKEHMTKFLELLTYVSYHTDEKAKVQWFVSGFPLAFRDQIKYDEPRSLEEVIGKLKHYYEQSKVRMNLSKEEKGKTKVNKKVA